MGTMISAEERGAARATPTREGMPPSEVRPPAFEMVDKFRVIVEALPVATYTIDRDGWITFYNEAATKLWGRRPVLHKERWCGSWRLYWPDGQPMAHDDCPLAHALATGNASSTTVAIAERPDGSRYFFRPHPAFLCDDAGRISGAVNVLVDVTEATRDEVAAQRLAAIVQSSDDAIISKDLDGVITSWNEAAERLFGYTAEEAIGKNVLILIPEERQGEEPEILDRIRRGERLDHYETVRVRKDGSPVAISLTVSPVKTAAGRIIGASKIARDITERKRTDEAMRIEIKERREAERAKELLVHEIKHRVKNTLGTVLAIASQTFREAPANERSAFVARLLALSGAHDVLTEKSWESVSVRDIVARATSPFQETGRQRFSISGPDAAIRANNAVLLAMIIHELGTNAVKYGALSKEGGRVSLDWTCEPGADERRLVMRWREEGGPPVLPPRRSGFGSQMIRRALQGEHGRSSIEFHPEGVVCSIEIAV